MNARTLKDLQDLASCMKEDPRVLSLDEAEKRLKEDEVAAVLHQKLLKAQEHYVLTRFDYGEDADETKKAQKDLYQAKLALDESSVAKEYSQCFSELNFLYRTIDDLLFHPFRSVGVCGGNHD